MDFTYEKYNKLSLVLRVTDGGLDHPCNKEIKDLQGRWNTRLKGGPGWTVPVQNEEKLKAFIANTQKYDNMQQHVKSRKNQHKYHRAVSDIDKSESESGTESDGSSSSSEAGEEADINITEPPKTGTVKVEDFCKTFTKSPDVTDEEEDKQEEPPKYYNTKNKDKEKKYANSPHPKKNRKDSSYEEYQRKKQLEQINDQLKYLQYKISKIEKNIKNY